MPSGRWSTSAMLSTSGSTSHGVARLRQKPGSGSSVEWWHVEARGEHLHLDSSSHAACHTRAVFSRGVRDRAWVGARKLARASNRGRACACLATRMGWGARTCPTPNREQPSFTNRTARQNCAQTRALSERARLVGRTAAPRDPRSPCRHCCTALKKPATCATHMHTLNQARALGSRCGARSSANSHLWRDMRASEVLLADCASRPRVSVSDHQFKYAAARGASTAQLLNCSQRLREAKT